MKNGDMLWNKFVLSGKVDDYLIYCANKNREEKACNDKHGRSDNQRKKFGRTEQLLFYTVGRNYISIRFFWEQIVRSRLRLGLNCVLLTVVIAFFVMSMNLYENSIANLQKADETYSTIALNSELVGESEKENLIK